MGLLDGLLEGFGTAGQKVVADSYAKEDEIAKEERGFQTQLKLLREKVGIETAAKDAERTNQTKRIGDKVSSYKDEALKQVMADAAKDGAPGDAPTSYEEMASDPAYAPFLKERGLLDSGRLREHAGIETGDISPEKAATLEEARLRNEEAVNERKQSRQDLKDYRDANLDLQRDKFDLKKGGGGSGSGSSALAKLPEATKMQVSSLLRTNEKLDTRYYALKEADFSTPEAYRAERDSLKEQIAANERKVMGLIGGDVKPKEGRRDLGAIFGAKTAPADPGKAATTDPVQKTEPSATPTPEPKKESDPVIREVKQTRTGKQYYIAEKGSRGGGRWISEAEKTRLGL